jgi:SAM-dependent methyltransferase
METTEVRQNIERLNGSIWAFSALCYAAEKGILQLLTEPRTLSYISERSSVPIFLAERILDMLVALKLASREEDVFVADKGLIPLILPPANSYFLASLRSNYLESRNLIESAKQPSVSPGWHYSDPEILQARGLSSASSVGSLVKELFPKLSGLVSRLQAPSARFLDIGTGVGAISIAACRALPNLHAVGIDNQQAPLAEARRNVAAAGLFDRIELRQQAIQDLEDKEAFDLAFFPQSFMPDDVVKAGLYKIFRALRPGGWIEVPTVCAPGMDLQAALSRLIDTLWGGNGRMSSQIEAMLKEIGYISVCNYALGATTSIVVGQRLE